MKQSFNEYFNMLEKTKFQIDSEFFVVIKSAYTNQIGLINLDTLKLTTKTINGYTVNCDYSTICSISSEKVFVYGGRDKTGATKSDGYIIDTEKGLGQKICNNSALSHAGATIKENIIYVFGGYNGLSTLSQSQSFNIISNTWKRLGDIPIASTYTSASFVDGFIYLTGYQMPNLLCYNEKANSYTQILALGANQFKYLFESFIAGNSYLYVQEGSLDWKQYSATWNQKIKQ